MSPFDERIIEAERLSLVPLRPSDAREMSTVLANEELHEFIGGKPPTAEALQRRYEQLAAGSPRKDEIWLNWIARRRTDGRAVGTVQASLSQAKGEWLASVAWVIGLDWQNQGYASEAAQSLVSWLRQEGADVIVANVHPEHAASAVVARRAGLEPTTERVEGEQVWRSATKRA